LEFAPGVVVELPEDWDTKKRKTDLANLLRLGCEIVDESASPEPQAEIIETVVAATHGVDVPTMDELRETARELGIGRVGAMGRERLVEKILDATGDTFASEDDG
jgi:hypothetical protein